MPYTSYMNQDVSTENRCAQSLVLSQSMIHTSTCIYKASELYLERTGILCRQIEMYSFKAHHPIIWKSCSHAI